MIPGKPWEKHALSKDHVTRGQKDQHHSTPRDLKNIQQETQQHFFPPVHPDY